MIRFEVIIDRDNLPKEAQDELQKAVETSVQETAAGLEVKPPLEFRPLSDLLNSAEGARFADIKGPWHTLGIWSPPPDLDRDR